MFTGGRQPGVKLKIFDVACKTKTKLSSTTDRLSLHVSRRAKNIAPEPGLNPLNTYAATADPAAFSGICGTRTKSEIIRTSSVHERVKPFDDFNTLVTTEYDTPSLYRCIARQHASGSLFISIGVALAE